MSPLCVSNQGREIQSIIYSDFRVAHRILWCGSKQPAKPNSNSFTKCRVFNSFISISKLECVCLDTFSTQMQLLRMSLWKQWAKKRRKKSGKWEYGRIKSSFSTSDATYSMKEDFFMNKESKNFSFFEGNHVQKFSSLECSL